MNTLTNKIKELYNLPLNDQIYEGIFFYIDNCVSSSALMNSKFREITDDQKSGTVSVIGQEKNLKMISEVMEYFTENPEKTVYSIIGLQSL